MPTMSWRIAILVATGFEASEQRIGKADRTGGATHPGARQTGEVDLLS